MTGGFGDDPFAGEHFDAGHTDDQFGADGTDHLGLADDATGADHDAGYHADLAYEHDAGHADLDHADAGHDGAYGEAAAGQDDPQPAEEPPGGALAEHGADHGADHPADLTAGHAADAETSQLDGTDTLPHSVDTSPFPPHLEVDVTPADGQDWVDPGHLGEPEPGYVASTESPQALLAGLHETEGADPATSDDPAIRSLALFWAR
jgi:hypothetical protein